MQYKDTTVVFTDIANSTLKTQEMGSEQFSRYREAHKSLAQELTERFCGKLIKSTGDGILATFDDSKNALQFATNLQYSYLDKPCKVTSPLEFYVSIHSGTVENNSNDVDGDTVNFAARLLSECTVNNIACSSSFIANVRKIFGNTVTDSFISSSHKFQCKGYNTQQELHNLSIDTVMQHKDIITYHAIAYEQLRALGFHLSNLDIKDFTTPSTVVWPVVPRDKLYIIHCGFVEVLRIFANLGWKPCILIADCGTTASEGSLSSFVEQLSQAMSANGVCNFEIKFLSTIFKPRTDNCCSTIFEHLFKYLSMVQLSDMRQIISKRYPEDEAFNLNETTLALMRPFLTFSGVCNMTAHLGSKSIVLSGDDERALWETGMGLGYERTIGSVHIPVLEFQTKHQFNQNKIPLHWFSPGTLVSYMSNSNIIDWSIRMFAALENFPFHRFTFLNKFDVTIDRAVSIVPDVTQDDHMELADYIITKMKY